MLGSAFKVLLKSREAKRVTGLFIQLPSISC